jgi:hypothetical protein
MPQIKHTGPGGGTLLPVEASDNLHAEYQRGEVEWAAMKRLWLFDIVQDPSERHDLSAQMPEKVAELRKRLGFYTSQSVAPHASPTATEVMASKSRFLPERDNAPVVDVWPPAALGTVAA